MSLDFSAIARAVIAVDSRSSVSDRPLVDVLLPLCRSIGLSTSLQPERRDGVWQYNLVAERPGSGATGPLLLNTHLDTVPPGDRALWSACDGRPFTLTERDGLLYGLGTADVKLDFVCKLLALERLRHEPLQRAVVLAGTYGEETGRYGAKLLASTLDPRPETALVGEPSRLRPCLAHKGYMEIRVSAAADAAAADAATAHTTAVAEPTAALRSHWRLTFEGTAAHSSQPHKGRSANEAALDALARLSGEPGFRLVSLEGGDLVNRVATRAEAVVGLGSRPEIDAAIVERLEGPPPLAAPAALTALLFAVHASTKRLVGELRRCRTTGFDPSWSTVNNGLVRLADGILSHVVDVRRLPGDRPLEAVGDHLTRLHQTLGACDCETELEQRLDSPPFRAASDSPLVTALEAALSARSMTTEPELKSGTTEASVYADAGIDTAVFGPGTASGNIHRPNECVPLADLEAAVDIYTDVIRRLCQG